MVDGWELALDTLERNSALDGVRGVGALIVLFWHLSVHFFPAAAWGSVQPGSWSWENLIFGGPFGVLVSGTFAVVLFFLMSGYVLTIGYIRSGDTDAMYRKLIGRIPRLFIPATGITIIFFFCYQYLWFVRGGTPFDVLRATGSLPFLEKYLDVNFKFTISELLSNIFWLPWFNPDFRLLYNGVLWTMSIELSGSFLVMILTMALYRYLGLRSLRVGLLVASVGALWMSAGYGIYFSFFLLGGFVAAIDPQQVTGKPWARWLLLALAACGLLAGGYTGTGITSILSFTQFNSAVVPSVVLLKGLGALAVFVATLMSPDISAFLSRRVFNWLGRVSFALYLIHPLFLGYVGHNVFLGLGEGVPVHYRTVISAICVIAVTLVSAAFLTKWLDEPAVRLSRRFGRYLVARRDVFSLGKKAI